VIKAVAVHGGFDAGAFERVAELVRGGTIPERDAETVVSGYVRGMDALVLHLDQYAPPSAA
jgi:hypothetical protein